MTIKTKKGTVKLANSLKGKLVTGALTGVLVLSMSGCGNYKLIDTKYSFDKAITIIDGVATIYDIEKWTDYEGEQIQLILKDGTIVLTSAFDSMLSSLFFKYVTFLDAITSILSTTPFSTLTFFNTLPSSIAIPSSYWEKA